MIKIKIKLELLIYICFIFIQRSQKEIKAVNIHEYIGKSVDPDGYEKQYINDEIGKIFFNNNATLIMLPLLFYFTQTTFVYI